MLFVIQWHVGDVIKKLRDQRGWSQRQLATKSGLTPNTLGYIESGEGNPRRDTLEQVAKELGVTVADLYALVPIAPTELATRGIKSPSSGFGSGLKDESRSQGGAFELDPDRVHELKQRLREVPGLIKFLEDFIAELTSIAAADSGDEGVDALPAETQRVQNRGKNR